MDNNINASTQDCLSEAEMSHFIFKEIVTNSDAQKIRVSLEKCPSGVMDHWKSWITKKHTSY